MLTRWSELDRMMGAMDLFRSQLDSLFEDFERPWLHPVSGSIACEVGPRMNLTDLGDRFEMRLEVPGLGKDDLSLRVEGRYVEISGTRKHEAPEGYTAHRLEREALSFSRGCSLPAEIAPDKTEATLKDGMLTLVLPKAEVAKPRQIPIH